MSVRRKRARGRERGAALVEAAFTIPILLLIAVGIFEFGRAYQFWQVLTNAARESARYAVTPGSTVDQAQNVALSYMNGGGVTGCTVSCVTVTTTGLTAGTQTTVTIQYPFQFMVIQPIVAMVTGRDTFRGSLTMTAAATMRNEGL